MHSILSLALTALPIAWGATLKCQEFLVPVNVSANNKVLPSNLAFDNLTSNFIFKEVPNLNNTVVKGQYNINLRYCEPLITLPERQYTLQVLVHGATYDRNYWSGLAAPGTFPAQDEYSWILYAAKQGYATLSVDRLCNGASSRPNSIADCQIPLETESLHALITMVRAGRLPHVPRPFKKIIVAGHSLGSLVANALSVAYPKDLDVLILSGFSFITTQGLSGLAKPSFSPANKVHPAAYNGSDAGYITAASASGDQALFYYGSFNQSFFQYDYAHRDTSTVGELATFALGQKHAPDFCGALFVLNGNDDGVLCQSNPKRPINATNGCATGYSAQVRDGYPAVSDFGFYNANSTGHCVNLHTTAQQSYGAVQRFLKRTGY